MFVKLNDVLRIVTRSLPNARAKFCLLVVACVSLTGSTAMGQVLLKPFPANAFSEQAKTLAEDGQSKWSAISEFVADTRKAVDAKDVSSVDPKKVGPAFAFSEQIKRSGIQLQYLREPCGVDFYHRGQQTSTMLERASLALRSTAGGKKIAQKAEKVAQTDKNRRLNGIDKINQLLSKGEMLRAEQGFNSLMQEIDEYFVWLSPASRQMIVNETSTLRRQLTSALKTFRAEEASRSLAEGFKAHNPNIDKLLEIAQSTAKGISSSGKAKLGNEQVEGPDALKRIVKLWQDAHANLVRCIGIKALAGKNADKIINAKDAIGTKLGASTLNEAVGELSRTMSATLSRMIIEDLRRPGAGDKTHYVRYLGTLGQLKNEVPDSFMRACETELKNLESGVGELATAISNYKKATDDVLLWRKRMATSMRNGSGKYLEVDTLTTTSINKSIALPRLTNRMDLALPELEPLVGELAVAPGVHAINKSASFSQLDGTSWATAMAEIDLSAEAAELEKDLYVTKEHPPLSLAAAAAIVTAKKNRVQAIGGQVASVQLEAIGNRIPRLSETMKSMIPLNKTPPIDEKFDIDYTMLRYNLKPVWVQHEYIFKKLK